MRYFIASTRSTRPAAGESARVQADSEGRGALLARLLDGKFAVADAAGKALRKFGGGFLAIGGNELGKGGELKGVNVSRSPRSKKPRWRFTQAALEAFEAGAAGYLMKDTFAEGILDAIRDVDAGELLFDEEVAAKLAHRDALPSLSPRELTILELIARGLSNKEIQSSLSIAEGTLRNHLKRIFDKFHVTDRTQAALIGIKRGLIRMP